MRRVVLAAVVAVSSFGAFAGLAGADPVGQLCSSVHVTVNGQALVDNDQCQVLPPSTK